MSTSPTPCQLMARFAGQMNVVEARLFVGSFFGAFFMALAASHLPQLGVFFGNDVLRSPQIKALLLLGAIVPVSFVLYFILRTMVLDVAKHISRNTAFK